MPKELSEEHKELIKGHFFEFFDVTNTQGETVTFKAAISFKTVNIIYKKLVKHFTE